MTSGWKYVAKQFVLILVIALLSCLFLAIGLMIGYSVIGEGKIRLRFYLWINGNRLLENLLEINKVYFSDCLRNNYYLEVG